MSFLVTQCGENILKFDSFSASDFKCHLNAPSYKTQIYTHFHYFPISFSLCVLNPPPLYFRFLLKTQASRGQQQPSDVNTSAQNKAAILTDVSEP